MEYAVVHTDVDEHGCRSYRLEIPDAPWFVAAWPWDDPIEAAGGVRRGPLLALQGKLFLLVPHRDPWILPGYIAHRARDPLSWLRLAAYHVRTELDPWRHALAIVLLSAGWIRMGDSARWRDLARTIINHTTAGEARQRV